MGILLYPFSVVLFWYKDGFSSLTLFFRSLNDYLIRLFSLQGLFATFFKPLKNEYRKNLILFSIIFGIAVKTILILVSIAMLGLVFILELAVVIFYLVFPFLPIALFLLT